jgi:hypothetical protein
LYNKNILEHPLEYNLTGQLILQSGFVISDHHILHAVEAKGYFPLNKKKNPTL